MNPIAPATVPVLSDAVFALTLALLLICPLAIAGVALINTGLGRSCSASQALLGNLVIVAVAAIVFALVGASFSGTLPAASGSAGFTFHAAGKPWNWLGEGSFLLRGLGSAAPQSQPWPHCCPGVREWIAGVSQPAAPRQRFWQLSSFLWPRTGFGMAAGWRNWE